MDNTVNFNIQFNALGDNKITATIQGINAQINGVSQSVQIAGNNINNSFNGIRESIKRISFTNVLDQIDRVTTGLDSVSQPGLKLSSNMADLSAITGVTGEKLKEIEGYARDSAKVFGVDAANGVESYKLILSQLSPEIAKQPSALKSMGESVSYLSKTMGGDTTAATEVLTTAMNQFQVSTIDPIKASKEMATMMNIMGAAAKEGSAELPQIKEALENSGMAAKSAGVSFAETNAAIQVLDKAGKKGSEGGIALRNIMSKLGQGRFIPKDTKIELEKAGIDINRLGDKSLTLAERMKPLKAIMKDGALVTKFFGEENSNAARALVDGISEQERLTKAIQGTNSVYEQAAIVMESPAEKSARLQEKIDDFKISLFNGTNGLLGYMGAIGNVTRDMTNLAPAISIAGSVLGTLTSKKKLDLLWTDITIARMKVSTIVTNAWTFAQSVGAGVVSFLTKATKAGAISAALLSIQTGIATGAQWAWNVAMTANPIGLIIAGIVALIATIAYVVYAFDGWGNAWNHTVKAAKLGWEGFVGTFELLWLKVKNSFMNGIDTIQLGWYKFKNAVGLGDQSENNAMIAKINSDADARKKAIVDGQKKVKNAKQSAGKEAVLAVNSIHSNGKGFGTIMTDIKAKIGIETPKQKAEKKEPDNKKDKNAFDVTKGGAGIIPATKSIGGVGAKDKKESSGTGGGSGSRNITIGKLIENMHIHIGGTIRESKESIKQSITEVLLTAVNDVNLAN
ncbi:TPA: phage tail tape measure protein [Flavobacterium psychrophilum]